MVKNRIIALITRLTGAAVAVAGLLTDNGFSGVRYLFYTYQSNLLAALLFIYLAVRTAVDISKNGTHGCACYAPRLQMGVTVTVFFTFLVFWAALAPFSELAEFELWSFNNLAVHLITPLLAAADYILYSSGGRLKKRDILYASLMPVAYIMQSYILGFCGVVFYVRGGVEYHYPYFFMDYACIGWYAVLPLLGIGALFVSAAALLYKIDRKRAGAQASEGGANAESTAQ